MKYDYGLIAIGGGSGGIAGANRAASYGVKCAVIEQARLGGTCVNVGCVPKKVMWFAANIANTIRSAENYGFDVSLNGFNWPELKQKRDAYIQRLNGIYANNLTNNGVDHIEGTASFIDPHTLQVGDRQITAERFLIATGGKPSIPNIPGAEYGITSDGFFELTEQPKNVAVIGAGFIAVELVGVFQSLGTQVSLIVRGDHALRQFDSMLGEELAKAMQHQGIRLKTNTSPTSIEKTSTGKFIIKTKDSQLDGEFDGILWAVGRAANTDGLNLHAAGLESDQRGFIQTDEWQKTTQDHIFAVGDVTGQIALTPVAIAAARRLSDRLYSDQTDRKLDYDLIPSVIFSHPPIGTIGLTEQQAKERHGEAVKVYTSSFNPMTQALSVDKQPTAMKLVTVGEDEKIIGCHLFGESSDEILQGFAVAIKMGATKKDFDDTVAIHPTNAEELVTMT
ncbi:MAG: glutathione-disulfide reductase [Cycloclasticus sp. symbiont of Poecilosclerida sp. M]|nr:MAG: glutathione-disulfide reductase [Cycloclasticus sp. symbiont of Poecilosclerida sp. M]